MVCICVALSILCKDTIPHTIQRKQTIQCNKKCKLQYIGETKHSVKNRMPEHIGYVRTKNLDKATGGHFNLPGHSI